MVIFGVAHFGCFAIFGIAYFTGLFGSHFGHFVDFSLRFEVDHFLGSFLHLKSESNLDYFSERRDSLVRGFVTPRSILLFIVHDTCTGGRLVRCTKKAKPKSGFILVDFFPTREKSRAFFAFFGVAEPKSGCIHSASASPRISLGCQKVIGKSSSLQQTG
jgi:hypothetical protein